MTEPFKQLTPEEKAVMKNRILSHLNLYPAGRPEEVRKVDSIRQHWWSTLLPINNFKLKPMPIFIALVLLFSGGTSFAAESSIPGDSLYPVKIYVNEKVRSFLAVDSESQAKVDTLIAERRLDEAEKLAASAKLDAEARAKLEANFEKFADRVQARIEELEEKNPEKAAELSAQFETVLKAHAQILENIDASVDGKVQPEVRILIKELNDREKKSSETRVENELKIGADVEVSAQAAAEGRLKAVENKIKEVRNFIDDHAADVSADVKARAEARLNDAANLVVEGKAKLEAKMYKEAFVLFQRAHMVAQEAKLLLNAKLDFENRVELKNRDKDDDESDDRKASSSVDFKSRTEVKGDDDDEFESEDEFKIKIDF